MKKVIALALAVFTAMSMATVAFASPAVASTQEPGADIKFAADDFGIKDSAYFSTDYLRIDSVKYKTGATLVESSKIDNGEFVITLKKNYSLERKTITNFEIEKISVKAIKSFTNDGATVEKYAVFTLAGQTTAFSVGYEVKTPADTTISEDGLYKFAMTESYKDYTFSKSDMSVEFRAYDGEKKYLGLNNDINKDLVKANEDAELTFYNFVGGTTVNNGKIFLNADKEKFVYELNDGKLVKSSLKWSDSDYAFTGKVSTLGSYVVSDKELKAIAAPVTPGTDAKNPNTGANDMLGVAAALAVLSLVAAGAVSLKK